MAARPWLASASAATAATSPPEKSDGPPPANAPAPAAAPAVAAAATLALPLVVSLPLAARASATAVTALAASLAADALASRRSDPTIQGQRVTHTLLSKEATTTAPSASAAVVAFGLPQSSAVLHSDPSPAATCLRLGLASPLLRREARPLSMPTMELDTGLGRHISWTSLADVDDNDKEEEVLAPLTPLTAKGCVGHETEVSEGWQVVLPRRGRRPPASSTPMRSPRPLPTWLFGRCCRCFAPGHRAAICRDPLRCSRCLENGHLARGCRNPWRPLSSLTCLVASPVLGTKHCQAPTSCGDPVKSVPPFKALHRGSWASVVSSHVGSATPSDVLLQSALAVQAEMLERVGSFLERAEAALRKLSLVPTGLQTTTTLRPPVETDVGSMEDKRAELYGCFSPRAVESSPLSILTPVTSSAEGEVVAEVVTPILQIMPELSKLCSSPVSPLSVEHMKVDSMVTSCEGHDSPLPDQQLEVNLHGHSNVALAPTSAPPTHYPDALFAKDLCDVLSSLEVVSPGFGRAIACFLTGTPMKSNSARTDTVKGKSLKCKGKKSGAIGKAHAVA